MSGCAPPVRWVLGSWEGQCDWLWVREIDATEGSPVGDAVDDVPVLDVSGVHEGWAEVKSDKVFVVFRRG